MLKYIIRLDDACPNMKKDKWDRMEKLLDKYGIKPIVGIIPDNKDEEFKKNPVINDFWEKYALKWQNKNWIIAQHGLNHCINDTIRTEYKGNTYIDQKNNLKEGYEILKNNNIRPICFFAPAHTFDNNTIKACVDLGFFKFISDGVATYPYKYRDMLFLPNIFDTPHKILPFGIYTFVYHPNNMTEESFVYLENFIKKNKRFFEIEIDEIVKMYSKRKKNILDILLMVLINIFRKIKGTKR